MPKVYFKRFLELTESEYTTLYNMLASYYPAYMDEPESITKEEKKDMGNAKKIKSLFGIK